MNKNWKKMSNDFKRRFPSLIISFLSSFLPSFLLSFLPSFLPASLSSILFLSGLLVIATIVLQTFLGLVCEADLAYHSDYYDVRKGKTYMYKMTVQSVVFHPTQC